MNSWSWVWGRAVPIVLLVYLGYLGLWYLQYQQQKDQYLSSMGAVTAGYPVRPEFHGSLWDLLQGSDAKDVEIYKPFRVRLGDFIAEAKAKNQSLTEKDIRQVAAVEPIRIVQERGKDGSFSINALEDGEKDIWWKAGKDHEVAVRFNTDGFVKISIMRISSNGRQWTWY